MPEQKTHVVTIFSTPTCVYCRMAKEFFKEHAIVFTDYNVAEDAQRRDEMMQRSGQMGVPVIDIDGQLVIGFDKLKLMQMLGITK